ncbi:MAG: hypothetical protein WCC95_02740 [Candidatus Sulfotelmatobacter sp.]|jgi:hypothetical protein
MFDKTLVPEKTVANTKGDGVAVDVNIVGASGRIFLLTLEITQIIEQESLELSIFGSTDGVAWGAKPLVSYPQKFYRGEYPFLLDLTAHPEAKFIRAHWDVARWGRGIETPMFEFGVKMKEIPADVLRELGGAKLSA